MRTFKQPSKFESLIFKIKALLGFQKPEPPKPPKSTLSLTVQQVAAMKAAGIWDNPARRSRLIQRISMEAPYGLTKDGVPKKKPGRKPARAKK
jgi:hypothetical protein